MSSWTQIGQLLRTARGDRSQEEVATAAGIARAFYTMLELGRRRCSVTVLGRLAGVLPLTPDDQLRILKLASAEQPVDA